MGQPSNTLLSRQRTPHGGVTLESWGAVEPARLSYGQLMVCHRLQSTEFQYYDFFCLLGNVAARSP